MSPGPRYLVTSAPPYTDGPKHLGNLAGSMLPADVYCRFLRARGEQVLFVCATDEHGTPAELAAAEAGLGVADYCAQQYEVLTRQASELGLSFDVFGRSSSVQNRQQTQYFLRRLDEEGYIEPRSAFSGGCDIELRESRHLFLLQSKLGAELRVWLESKSDWPSLTRSIAMRRLEEGVEDRLITRDSRWGIPVDWTGFEGKVFDGWFDAPIAYIGATREWAEARGEPGAWREWWCADEDVRYVQFITRDNVPFHSVGFPCAIIGSREPWKAVDFLKAFGWLTYDEEGFSSSRRHGVLINEALDLLPPDCWRYYLMANAPEDGDARFSWEALATTVNEDLAGGFGELVSSSLAFVRRRFGGAVPAGGRIGAEEARLTMEVEADLGKLTQRMSALEFREAVSTLTAAWDRGNAYLARKQPWVTAETDPEGAAATARTCVNLVSLLARVSSPLIPFAAERVLDALRVPKEARGWPARFDAGALGAGHELGMPPALFRRIEEPEVERWRDHFGTREAVAETRAR